MDRPEDERVKLLSTMTDRLIGLHDGILFNTWFTNAAQVARFLGATRKFNNCDFNNLDLYALDLSNCVFDACDFRNTRLGKCENSRFYSCDLTRADATDANFAKCEAMNCEASGLKLTGAIISVDCNFLSGLITEKETDAAKLLYWTTQLQNPFAKIVREHIQEMLPEHVVTALDLAFQRDPTN